MILGNQVEWALHCMATLARLPAERFIPTKILAEFHGVPKEYLSKALQALASEGLLEGTLGPKGGYRLARPAHEVSLLAIVEAVEGSRKTFNCQEIRFNNPCVENMTKAQKGKASVCQIAKVMYQADEAWRRTLREKKLSDIVQDVVDEVPAELLAKSDEWILN